VQATVRAIADAVHANSSAYVTVGSAQLHDVSDWTGLGLDYYEAHWYDAFSAPDDPTAVTYAQAQSQYHVDAPLVIGEFNTTTSDQTAFSRFSTLQANGYAGAWPWSLLPDHTSDHLAIDFPGAQAFAAQALGLAAAPLTSPPGQLPALPSTTAVQGPEVQGPAVQGPPFAAAPFPSFLPSPALAQPSSAPPSRAASPSPVDTTATANPFAGTQPLATAQCQDGWFSFSQTAALTCAGHGGVMVWVTQPGTAAAVVASRADEQAATNPNPGCQVFVGDGEFTGECSGPSLQSGGGSGPTGGGGGGATSGGGGGATGCGSRGGPGYRLPSGKCA